MESGTHVQAVQTGTQAAENQAMQRQSRMLAGGIILLFLLFGFAYSLVVPPFETPDEPFHYGFAWHIAQGNGLPVQSEVETGPWAQEGSQAPLYYLLTGWMTRPLDQSDFANIAVRNPRANIGDPLDPGNKNFMLYSGRQPPLTGSNLALHIGRWFSLLLGAVTLLCVYLTAELGVAARARTPAAYQFAVLATAFVAAIPQFLFISASFTNDTLIITACAATVYLLARLLAKPTTEPIRWYAWVTLGALIGIAALSKLQGLGLIPLAGLVVLFLGWRRRSWRLIFAAAILIAVPAAAISGWWYVRNILLYGDWSGLGHLTAINGRRIEPLTLEDFWPEFRGLRYSFWGLFGWFNILLPDWFYLAADVLSVVGALGVVGVLFQRVGRTPVPPLDDRPLRIIVLLITWAVLIFVLLIYWTLQATGSQGRLIFPGIIAYGILLPLGIDFWLQWLSRRARYLVWALLLLTMLGMSGYALLWLLPAAYNAPPGVSGLPQGVQPADITYAAETPVQLVAVEVGNDRYHPGERAPVTLYWRTEQALQENYQLFIQFLDESGREVANLTSHPGWGRNPTTLWQPGALYADHYDVLVKGPLNSSSPLLARVYTGLIDPASVDTGNLPLKARAADGTEITPFVSTVELAPWQFADPNETPLQASSTVFGDVIRLDGYHVPPAVSLSDSGTVTVTLAWQALNRPATDYTAYVHVLDAQGEQVAGYDQAPAAGRFPTSRWQNGDRIFSSFPISLRPDLPPGEYQTWVGLYDTASAGALRLPITNAGGLPSGDGQVQIGTFTVQPSP
jgi:MFS family permease